MSLFMINSGTWCPQNPSILNFAARESPCFHKILNLGIANKHLERNAPQCNEEIIDTRTFDFWTLEKRDKFNLFLASGFLLHQSCCYFILNFFDWLTRHLSPWPTAKSMSHYGNTNSRTTRGTRKLWCSAVDEQLKSMFGLS